MNHHLTILIGTFTTLIAVINPLETLPIFMAFSKGKNKLDTRKLAFRSCLFALILMLSFLVLGTFILEIFGVNLSMVRTVGGIILLKIGFDLFNDPSKFLDSYSSGKSDTDPAFVPLALPIMFGPGVLATVLSMTATKKGSEDFATIAMVAIASLACMVLMYFILSSANQIVKRIGQKGIDAATRLVGFFVATMGMGLMFHGIGEFLGTYLK
ncbi:MAG TPA: MarC family protein [Bacteroidales bacterium]